MRPYDYGDAIVVKEYIFSVHKKTVYPTFLTFSGLKSVFEKLSFRDDYNVDGWSVGCK